MLKCGFYEADITPSIGCDRPGAFDCRPITKIEDELYAHAFAFQADGDPMIIISMDTIMIEHVDVTRIRQGISKVIGIPEGNISVAAIHTHTGGPVADSYGDIKKEAEYCDYMVRHAIDAGVTAFQRMQPAKIGIATCEVHGIAFNRRFWMKDGSFRTNPGIMNPNIKESADVTDPQYLVIRVDDAEGNPMGMISSYALHPDTTGGRVDQIASADYPGVIRSIMRKQYGEKFACLYLTGACGNVNHHNVWAPKEEQNNYKSIGKKLAENALRLYEQIETEDVAEAKFASTIKVCRMKRPTAAECEKMDNALIKREMLRAMDLPEEEVELEVWTAKIGDIVIHMLPGEVFTRFGLDIKANTGNPNTVICELSNYDIGYIYTKEAEKQGGYEAVPTTYIKMNSDTGYKFVEAAAENMKKLGC